MSDRTWNEEKGGLEICFREFQLVARCIVGPLSKNKKVVYLGSGEKVSSSFFKLLNEMNSIQ